MISHAIIQFGVDSQPGAIANEERVNSLAAACASGGGHPGGHDAHSAVPFVAKPSLQASREAGQIAAVQHAWSSVCAGHLGRELPT